LDMTLKQVVAEQMVRETHAHTVRRVARANDSWARARELCELDTELVGRSRDLIQRGRHRLATLDKPVEE